MFILFANPIPGHYFEVNENEPLRRLVIANNRYAYNPIESNNMYLVNEYKSFCTILNGGVVIIVASERKGKNKLSISIQTNSSHNIIPLYFDDDIYGKLTDLVLQITAKTNDSFKFINDILNL